VRFMRRGLLTPSFLLLCLPFWACASGGQGFLGGDAGVDGGSIGSHFDATSSPDTSLHSGGDSTTSCKPSCSADLHTVIGCNGATSMCSAAEGCTGGSCVPACEAASASKSSVGCDYYSAPPGQFVSDGSIFPTEFCFAAFVANTWGSPLTVGVEYDGMTLDTSTFAVLPQGTGSSLTYTPLPGGQVPASTVAILFLASITSTCPGNTVPAVPHSAQAVGTAVAPAFHITTSLPAVVYDMFPYGGAASAITSATLLLPTPVWDVNYVAVDAYAASTTATGAQPFTQIVASVDGTMVSILPSAAIVGAGSIAGSPAGVTKTYPLAKGQLLQFAQDAELIGSIITANNPIGVWGGATCLNIDVGEVACDSAHQELFPVKALGHEYVASRYRDRLASTVESVPWHIVGAVDGTTLTYDPPTPPVGAPTTLSSGQVALFSAPGPFVVSSQDAQHPFYVSGHMTGWSHVPGNTGDLGDPEFVNIIPPQQYLESYVFFTDPTYANTNLVFVRQKSSGGTFNDVNLDCLGIVSGWQAVGSGAYEVAHLDLAVAGAAVGACNNGRHQATSLTPFGLTVWGWDFAVSYAYPAGASVQQLSTVVIPTTPK
jgi:hypothetical protein